MSTEMTRLRIVLFKEARGRHVSEKHEGTLRGCPDSVCGIAVEALALTVRGPVPLGKVVAA